MVVKAAKCLVSVLCVPRQFQPKTAMVRQHLKDDIVSPLSISVLMNRKKDSNSSAVREMCMKGTAKKPQQCNIKMPLDLSNQFITKASPITHQLKAEVVSPVSENIFDDRTIDNDSTSRTNDTSKEEAKQKIQEYINTLKGDFKQNQHSKEEEVVSEGKLLNSQINNSCSTNAIQGEFVKDTKKAEQCNITPNPVEMGLPEGKIPNKQINNKPITTIISNRSRAKMIKKAKEFNIAQNLAVSKQTRLKASTVKIPQHLRDEVVSTLAGNIFENRTANQSINSTTRDPSEDEKNAQKGNTVVTDFPKLFEENTSSEKIKQFKEEKLSPIPESMSVEEKNINSPVTSINTLNAGMHAINADPCRGDPIKKVRMCDVTLKPSDNLKKGKSVASANKKEYLTLNASPPLPQKLCVAMNLRFNIGIQSEKELKECKIMPKCHNQRDNSAKRNACNPNYSSKGPMTTLYATKASVSGSKPISYQQPESK